jgi:TRAP-type C4-dicarboxylate transport system permease large subunit
MISFAAHNVRPGLHYYLVAPFIPIGGIVSGAATPTELPSTVLVYALLLRRKRAAAQRR